MTLYMEIVLLAGIAITLSGCGGSGGSSTTTSSPTTAPPSPSPSTTGTVATSTGQSTTTTSTKHQKSPPVDGQEVADWLNKLYFGFDAKNDASPLGVTLSLNHEFALYCGTPCYNGAADCRMSTSLMNHELMLTWDVHPRFPLDRASGFVFNQTRVQNSLAKCSYMFDGATDNRYNGGCGLGAHGGCTPGAAYYNICPSSKTNCTAASPEVKGGICVSGTPIPHKTNDAPCFWPGPSFDYPRTYKQNDQMRDMVKTRLQNQGKPGDPVSPIEQPPNRVRLSYWTEVVIDERVLRDELAEDPASVMPAFLYVKARPATKDGRPLVPTSGFTIAKQMRDKFMKDYDVPGPGLIPLIEIDDCWNATKAPGPFSFKKEMTVLSV